MSDRGRLAIVTGAASGIGREIARTLAGEGMHVVGVDINAKALDELRSMSAVQGWAVDTETADLTKSESIDAMLARLDQFGKPLQVVVHAAGINVETAPIWEMDEDRTRKMLDVQLWSALILAKHALPRLIRSGAGNMVFIASRAGVRGTVGQAAYSAAKAGIIGLVRVLAKESFGTGVTVNAVAPGWIVTEASSALLSDKDGGQAAMVTGTPADIASVVSFLVSENSRFVNGETVLADGGDSLRYGLDSIFSAQVADTPSA